MRAICATAIAVLAITAIVLQGCGGGGGGTTTTTTAGPPTPAPPTPPTPAPPCPPAPPIPPTPPSELFASALDGLKARVKQDFDTVCNLNSSTSTKKVIKDIFQGGFDSWESDMTMQKLQKIVPQGAPTVLKSLTKSACAGQPPKVQAEIQNTFAGILNASTPLVYSSLGCSDDNACTYVFLVGRTDNITKLTDLIVIRYSASFKLAPKLVVVRETNRTTVTDKIKMIPEEVTLQDIDGILAFFEISTVQFLSKPSVGVVGQV